MVAHDVREPVRVSRRIDAPAEVIFTVLADPTRHTDFDGSQMLQGSVTTMPVTAVGDVFVMKMHHPQIGDYVMDNHVVEFEINRRIGWEPRSQGATRSPDEPQRNGSRWAFELAPDGPRSTSVTEVYDCSGSPDQVRAAVDNGAAWTEGMTKSLEQLDELCGGFAADG